MEYRFRGSFIIYVVHEECPILFSLNIMSKHSNNKSAFPNLLLGRHLPPAWHPGGRALRALRAHPHRPRQTQDDVPLAAQAVLPRAAGKLPELCRGQPAPQAHQEEGQGEIRILDRAHFPG